MAIFGGIYFVVVTAAEMMGFGTSAKGIAAFGSSPSLLGDLGSSYVGSWVGNVITAGTTVSAFGCCLACTVGAARMIYAMSRDSFGARGAGAAHSRWGTPAAATGVVTVMAVIIYVVYVAVSTSPSSVAENAFLWSGTIGTLILLVVYVLATIGMTLLVFVRRKMPSVPMWQVIVPIAAIIVLGYTLYRNVYPYPAGDGHWFPIVAGAWLLAAVVGVLARAAHGAPARRRADVPRGHLPVRRHGGHRPWDRGEIRVIALHPLNRNVRSRKFALSFRDRRCPPITGSRGQCHATCKLP